MPRLIGVRNLGNINDVKELSRFTAIAFNEILNVVNGNLEVDQNLKMKVVSATFNTANQELAISHGLQKVPIGYVRVGGSGNGIISDGITAWNVTSLYIQASIAGTYNILIF